MNFKVFVFFLLTIFPLIAKEQAVVKVELFLDYRGCHLCNDKIVEIVKKLKVEFNGAPVEFIAKIKDNKDHRRLKRWFENFDLNTKIIYHSGQNKGICLIDNNSKDFKCFGNKSIYEQETYGEIVKWIGNRLFR
jgi:hydrogenase maturation factor HypE